MRLREYLLAASTLVAACASPGSDAEPGSASDEIQGGSSDTASTFAVAVLDGRETCSGTLIAPNLVMTARHCVSDDSGRTYVNCARDKFTHLRAASLFHVSTAARATMASARFDVSTVLVPDDDAFCGNDIALLILDASIPPSAGQLAVPVLTRPPRGYGRTLTAVGYGTTSAGGTNQGTRRRRAGIPIACLGAGCDPDEYEVADTELAAGNGLCEGDSGAGAFISVTARSRKVIGVLSRAYEDGSTCTDAVFTRTDAFVSFLVAGALQAATAGDYAVPSWALIDAGTLPTVSTVREEAPSAQ